MKRFAFFLFLAPLLVHAEDFHAHYNPDGTVNLEMFPWHEHKEGTASDFMRGRCFDPLGEFDEVKRENIPPRSERLKWRGRKGQGIRVDQSVIVNEPKTLDQEVDELKKQVNDLKILTGELMRSNRAVPPNEAN